MTHLGEATGSPDGEPHSAMAPQAMPPAAEPTKQRLTPKRLFVTFVAVLGGTVGGVLIANAIDNGGSSGGMAQWMSSYGANYLAVSHDVVRVNTESSSASIRGDCERLAADVRTARTNPPMPIGTLEAPWSSILTNLQNGARACISGIDQQSRTSLGQAVHDLNQAGTEYLQLIRAVNAAT